MSEEPIQQNEAPEEEQTTTENVNMEKFEQEVEDLRAISGVDPDKYPIRWIKWETQYKSPNGTRAPPWRESEGDLGYVIASTHDSGIVVIMCKNDGTAAVIKGYVVEPTGNEVLCYDTIGSSQPDIKSCLKNSSEVFSSKIDEVLGQEQHDEEHDRKILDNALISLPQPVLVLTQPTNEVEKEEAKPEPVDDEPVIPYPRLTPSEQDYWNILSKMRNFAQNSVDLTDDALSEVAGNPNLKEIPGQRAILDAGALPAMLDVLRIKTAQHAVDPRQNKQAESVVQILSQITVSPNIRRHLATDDAAKILLEIFKKEEPSLMEGLFTTIANCCHNRNFREYIIKNDGVATINNQTKQPQYISNVCYVLWTLNRSEEATSVMKKNHLLIKLDEYYQQEKMGEELKLNITRLLYSLASYDPSVAQQMNNHQMQFLCAGLASTNSELIAWASKAFTVFTIPSDLQKAFCATGYEGPQRLIKTLDNKDRQVILSGLESISIVGQIPIIRTPIVQGGIYSRLQKLWKDEDPDIRKGTIRALGILTQEESCAKWTVKQNLIPDLIEYLHSTDPEFVIYSAKMIGSCCTEKGNLEKLMSLNGVRILWSLMKSEVSGVQAAATRALVPFLRSENSPSIVRTFVDGLDLLVHLLKSNDPEVQASACMAISEIARDKENLAFMTDLGLVELLSRLLSTKLDSVRKPLADAIGVSANYSNNRRRFGEEGAVDPLVSYLRVSNNKDVHAATAKALKALSEDSENSNKLRHAGVVDYLLRMVESKDQDLQMAAAVAIRNIRTNCVLVEE